MSAKEMYTTHDISAICGVALTTVAAWIDKGKLRGFRTPGGHRRVKRTDVVNFLRQYSMPVPTELEEDKCNVVLVQPDADLARMSTEAIEEDGGYRVEVASSALQAGVAVTGGKADMVVVDLDTPGLDAVDLTRVIRSNPKTRRIPVLILGNPGEQEVEELTQSGASDFLMKPFDGRRVLKKVRRHCPPPVRY